ncbi:unnamed protein product [Ectocarpus sp. 12 AP-2014]
MNSIYTKEGSVVTNNLGMRRSCCECGRKKRKCDGLIPCSRCRGSGVQCTYSKRKPHQRQPGHQRQRRPRGPPGMKSKELLRHSSSGALLACGMLPLKRFRWSASPATGLVGMQENACLSDFFGCIGFMPLTTRSHIRGAMVRMMAGSTPHHQSGAPHDSPAQGQFGSIFTEDGITTGNQLSTGPSACTFWCAVGLGALVKGSPVESVVNYSRLARDALDAYTGPVDAEVAKAWAILGYLYGFMGDTGKFEDYLELSDSFLTAAIEQGSTDMLPAGFAEIVNHKQTVKVYSGNAGPTDIEPLGARRQHPPQVNPVACEEDVFQYVSQSLVAFEQAVFEKVCEKRSTREQWTDDEPCLENRAGASPHGNVIEAEEVSDAMVAGLKDGLIEFEHLQETVDRRPNVCSGVGGLLINIPLAYSKAANGDASGTLERFGHCVEVFERYPGVCRCMMNWCHLAHGTLGALAAIDDSRARGLYNRLRDVYNSSRHPTSLPAPPLEEWRGISAICDHFQCRLTEGVIASKAVSVFSTPLYCSSNCVGPQTTCKREVSPIVVEEHHDSMVSVGVIPENATGAMMVAPFSNGDKPMASTSWWELNQEPVPQMSPPAGPSLFSADLHGELFREGASDTDVYGGAVEGCGVGVVPDLAGQVPDMSLTSPLLGVVDGGTEEIGDDTVAAADWLDVTHAMLDATDVNPVP